MCVFEFLQASATNGDAVRRHGHGDSPVAAKTLKTQVCVCDVTVICSISVRGSLVAHPLFDHLYATGSISVRG